MRITYGATLTLVAALADYTPVESGSQPAEALALATSAAESVPAEGGRERGVRALVNPQWASKMLGLGWSTPWVATSRRGESH